MDNLKKYVWNWLVILSQSLSVLLGGDPDMSLSQRVGSAYRWHRRHNQKSRKFKLFGYLVKAIDLMFWNKLWKIEKDHTLNSLYGERMAGQVWSWNKK